MATDARVTPSRVVVRMPNWLGDVILALPALRAVRAHFVDAVVTVAAPASVAPIFAEATGIGSCETLVLPDTRRARIEALRQGRFDVAVLFTNSFGSAWAARSAAIPERWGYRRDFRGALLTRKVGPPKGRVHQAEYYRRLVSGLGLGLDDGPPFVGVANGTRKKARELLERAGWQPSRPLVGLAPGAAYGRAKRWPPARVAALVGRLVSECGTTAVLVGAPGDRDAGRAIESSLATGPVRETLINLIGQTDLRVAAGVLSHCRAFVTNDSGAMHLAAAIGLPVTAVFGPTDERVTAPVGSHEVLASRVWCRPCMLRECPIDHRCMKRITPEMVLEAVSRQIDRIPEGDPS